MTKDAILYQQLVIDPLMGGEAPRAINQTSDQIQTQLLSSLGMAELLTIKEVD